MTTEEKRKELERKAEGAKGKAAERKEAFTRKVRDVLAARKDLSDVFRKGLEEASKHTTTVRSQFIKRKDTYGIGEGDGEFFVIVDERVKDPSIPTEIDGVPVKIEFSSRINYMPAPFFTENTGRKKSWRPIPGGVAGGHYNLGGYGTIGCVVYKGGVKHVLSNNHVFARTNRAKIGDRMSQPRGAKFDFGTLAAFIPLKNGVNVDCAIARPDRDEDVVHLLLKSNDEYEPYTYSKGVTAPTVGQSVMKSGARTGYTEGKVTSVHTTLDVCYGFVAYTVEDCIYTSLIGGPGDSGSLVLEKSSQKAVGLLFCGSNTGNGHSDISNVLDALGCNMPTEVGEIPRIGFLDITGSDKAEIWAVEK